MILNSKAKKRLKNVYGANVFDVSMLNFLPV